MKSTPDMPTRKGNRRLPEPGDLLGGKVRIERLLGAGAMGVVYAARHEILCQPVAVKLMSTGVATNAEVVRRFLNEARAAAQIESEHVARVMDVGTYEPVPDAGATPYIVMELLEGDDLEHLLNARGRLEASQAVDYILEALDALAQAHLLGIVHRDLKPANLFLARRRDGRARIKVLDFGISKSTKAASGFGSTTPDSFLGTPYYVSPEQARNAKAVDARTDIWSLGVILHELLAGSRPFEKETLPELLLAIVEGEPCSLPVARPDIPPALADVVARCLRRDPAERPQSAGDLARALVPFASSAGVRSAERLLGTVDGSVCKPSAVGIATPSAAARPVLQVTVGPWGTTNDSTTRARPRRWRSALALVGGFFALAACASGLAHLARGETPTLASAEPSGLVPIASAVAPSVVTAAAPMLSASPSREEAPPTPTSARPAPVVAPALPMPKRRAVPTEVAAAGTASSPARSNCTPPYVFDDSGKKRWKRECL